MHFLMIRNSMIDCAALNILKLVSGRKQWQAWRILVLLQVPEATK
jgi:hypothetical protein